jgi:CRP-like cAMP-binding protein
MSEPSNQTTPGFQEGSAASAADMQSSYGIPAEEFAAFRDITRIYRTGEIIIKEGDQEHALYLLRAGRVEVFKGADTSREPMGAIAAPNIFGEMSMINDEPRSATVQSSSDGVVVYRIPSPNIHTILTNPLWAELLITRLARNLATHAEQRLALTEQVKVLQLELARLRSELANRPT